LNKGVKLGGASAKSADAVTARREVRRRMTVEGEG
jgi:hypothetical protein